tara:strand:+ start:1612 stop:2187 length:576 start_codon:yes stop_codon:yes gene_type:complete
MTLREDDNNKSTKQTNSLQTLDNKKVDFSAQCGIIITVEGMNPDSLERTHNMANSEIFIATAADMTLAFSSIGPAFTFIQDSHADLCAEGSALMLADVPATSKQVKDSYRRVLRFTVTGADSASQVAAAQSALDGALQACELVGVDPANVSKVAELQVALDAARESVNDDLDAPELTITRMTLHKRGYKRS